MGINYILIFFKIFIRTKVSLFEHIRLFVCNTRLGDFLSLLIAVDTSGSFFVCNKQRNFWSIWYFGGIQNAICPHFELMNIQKKWLRKRHYLTSNLEKTSRHVIMTATLVLISHWVDRRKTNKHTLVTHRTNMPPNVTNPTWLPPATNQKALFQLHHGKFICWKAYGFPNQQSMLISLPPVYPVCIWFRHFWIDVQKNFLLNWFAVISHF